MNRTSMYAMHKLYNLELYNLELYNLKNKVTVKCEEFHQQKIEYNIVYIDPPWGGIRYDRNRHMVVHLSLSTVFIFDIVFYLMKNVKNKKYLLKPKLNVLILLLYNPISLF